MFLGKLNFNRSINFFDNLGYRPDKYPFLLCYRTDKLSYRSDKSKIGLGYRTLLRALYGVQTRILQISRWLISGVPLQFYDVFRHRKYDQSLHTAMMKIICICAYPFDFWTHFDQDKKLHVNQFSVKENEQWCNCTDVMVHHYTKSFSQHRHIT